MTTSRRTITGIGAFLASLTLVLPVVQIVNIALGGGGLDEPLATIFVSTLIAAGVVFWIMLVVFIVDANRNQRLSEGWRAGWIVAIACVGFIAIPLYWWRHVRTRPADG